MVNAQHKATSRLGSVRAIVISDLDGTLLDHETYDWAPAKPAIQALGAKNIPLVLASSKTEPEIHVLQAAMGLQGLPAIVENGAGVIGLHTQVSSEGAPSLSPRQRILKELANLPDTIRKGFRGFHDMSVGDLMADAGLDENTARMAMDRQFSEPGVWQGSAADKQTFLDFLKTRGIHAKQGGRYLSLSYGGDKADQIATLIAQYATDACRPFTLALGDAPNDAAMLEAADCGVIIANPAHDALLELKGEAVGRITRTRLAGPAGWNEAVLNWLETVDTDG